VVHFAQRDIYAEAASPRNFDGGLAAFWWSDVPRQALGHFLDTHEIRKDPPYEADRCIERGCCIAACGVANVNGDFAGAAGLNRVARFMLDPRDSREDADWFDVVANEDGIFGCLGMMACNDICPKELPLLEVYGYLRRKILIGSLGLGKAARSD
jgi:succinate dehydrogenase/fumarate reductase-like Fe-S protein